jgi:hypothetical protein
MPLIGLDLAHRRFLIGPARFLRSSWPVTAVDPSSRHAPAGLGVVGISKLARRIRTACKSRKSLIQRGSPARDFDGQQRVQVFRERPVSAYTKSQTVRPVLPLVNGRAKRTFGKTPTSVKRYEETCAEVCD